MCCNIHMAVVVYCSKSEGVSESNHHQEGKKATNGEKMQSIASNRKRMCHTGKKKEVNGGASLA